MALIHKAFVELTPVEKVEFFVHCQRLLTAHHPRSSFVVRKSNFKERLEHMRTLLANYKGKVYQDEQVCVLYNYLVLPDAREPETAVRYQMFKAPADPYNAIIIDFVVFREMRDCLTFVKDIVEPKLQHVLFARHNRIKVYSVVDLLHSIFKVPVMG